MKNKLTENACLTHIFVKQNRKENIGFVFLFLFYCLFTLDNSFVSFFLERPVNFGQAHMQPVEFFPIFALSLVCFVVSMILIKPKITTKEFQISLSLGLFWMASQIIRIASISSNPYTIYTYINPLDNSKTTSLYFSVSYGEKWMDVCCEFTYVLLIFSLFIVLPKLKIKSLFSSFLLWTFVIVGIMMTLLSFNKNDLSKYAEVFNLLIGKIEYANGVSSFTPQKNAYAYMLWISMFACVILNEQKERPYIFWPIIIYLQIMMVFSLCKFLLLLDIFLLPIYGIYRLCLTYKQHRVRNLILATIILFLLAVLLTLIFLLAKDKAIRLLRKLIGKDYASFGTINARIDHWKITLTFMDTPFRILFGWGMNSGENLNLAYQKIWMPNDLVRTTHNGILDIYLRYGIFGILMVLFLIALLMKYVFNTKKNHSAHLMYIYTCLICITFIYSLLESKFLFYRDIPSTMYLAVLIVPIIAMGSKQKEIKAEEITIRNLEIA